jgi:error-prone DNA polymerase
LGLRLVLGLSEAHARQICAARRDGLFASLADFSRRTRLGSATIARLAEADAFASLKLDRRLALWHALAQDRKPEALSLLTGLEEADDPLVELPRMSPQEETLADYQTSGLTLRAHPISFQRETLAGWGVVPAAELQRLPHDRYVRVAGLVLVRQRPGTAKGITFVTLEDETGTANLIVRQDVWQRYYQAARTASALIAHGRLQRQQGVTHVLVTRLEDLSQRLAGLRCQSRDFH